jgi:hypothetical protein
MRFFLQRSDVLGGPDFLVGWQLSLGVPLSGVFHQLLQVNAHLLDEVASLGRYWHYVEGDTLEDVEEGGPVSLVQLIEKFRILIIVLLVQHVFPDCPALQQALVLLQAEEVLSDILELGFALEHQVAWHIRQGLEGINIYVRLQLALDDVILGQLDGALPHPQEGAGWGDCLFFVNRFLCLGWIVHDRLRRLLWW